MPLRQRIGKGVQVAERHVRKRLIPNKLEEPKHGAAVGSRAGSPPSWGACGDGTSSNSGVVARSAVGFSNQSIERALDVANIRRVVCSFASLNKLCFTFPELIRYCNGHIARPEARWHLT
jgi:hypothetical protein